MTTALIKRLTEELGYPEANPATLPELIAQPACLVLFFPGNPERYPESSDVAVILPELIAAFSGRLQPAVVSLAHEEQLRERYPFDRWPALVFLRSGVQIGTISKVRDWADYLEQITNLLEQQAVQADAIPVVHL
jgi:hydrogenase-1 operon protein HyaE